MRAVVCTYLFWYFPLRLRRFLRVLRTTCNRRTDRVIHLCVDILRAPHLQMYRVVATLLFRARGNRQSFDWGREPLSRLQSLPRAEAFGWTRGLMVLKNILVSKSKGGGVPCWGYPPNTGVISALLAGGFHTTPISIKTVTPGVIIKPLFLATT